MTRMKILILGLLLLFVGLMFQNRTSFGVFDADTFSKSITKGQSDQFRSPARTDGLLDEPEAKSVEYDLQLEVIGLAGVESHAVEADSERVQVNDKETVKTSEATGAFIPPSHVTAPVSVLEEKLAREEEKDAKVPKSAYKVPKSAY